MFFAGLLPKKLILVDHQIPLKRHINDQKDRECRMSREQCDYKIPPQLTIIHRVQL